MNTELTFDTFECEGQEIDLVIMTDKDTGKKVFTEVEGYEQDYVRGILDDLKNRLAKFSN